RIDEIAEVTGVFLPDDEVYDTVSGLVLARLGHIPAVGEHVAVALPMLVDEHGHPRPQGTARLTVTAVRRHVPDRVAMTVLPADEGQVPR
ncbi:transporter associated domain-containing protein, partial [Krasilnikovia cinnamomea]